MKTEPLSKEEFLKKLNVDAEFNKKFGRKQTQQSKMALPPCHHTWQILSDGKVLDLIWMQRSVDTFLGLPYNIASYGLLLLLLAKELNLTPRRLVGQLADTHLYVNHMEQVDLQLSREPMELPTVTISDENWNGILNWTYKDFTTNNYKSHDAIKAPIAI